MERGFGNTRDYMYPGYGGTGPQNSTSNENTPNLSNDILHNFPYLQHGFNFSPHPQTSSSSQQDSRNTVNYKTANFQQTFPQISGSHVQSIESVPTFQSFVGSSPMSQGMLPSVSTFTSALPQATLASHFHPGTPNICDVQGHEDPSSFPQKNYRYHPTDCSGSAVQTNEYLESQTTPLPGFQNLVSLPSTTVGDLYSTAYENSVLHGSTSSVPVNKHVQQLNSSRPTHMQPSNYGSSQTSFPQDSISSSNFYNLVNHAVKMSPVQISEDKSVKGNTVKRNSLSDPVMVKKHSTDFSRVKKYHVVKFYLKGRLSNPLTSRSHTRLTETFDLSDSYGDCELNYSTSPNLNNSTVSQPSRNTTQSVTPNRKEIYKEPSLAEIRASVDQLNKDKNSSSKPALISAESIKVEHEEANEPVNVQGFSLGGEGNMHESWYSSAIKRYGEINKEDNSNHVELCAKKGGRSDPDNPFAITSPSFSASAARALMTTTNSATATTVRISIMSIGSRKKLLPDIVNSQAAQGGILSVINPVDIDSEVDYSNDPAVKAEKMSIMSKLKRDRQEKNDQKEEELDTEIDRLDIDITIDDDQYVGEGSQKRWQCKICPKSYTTKHNLLAHILDHSSIKPHLCLVCGKYFKQLSHLNTHMLTHDHVKPYKCKVCEKGFTQISHLKRHETVHLESKPYICDVCNRGFAFPSELRIHKDKHIFGKEKCMDCDKEFNTVEELKEHMVTEKHGDELTCKHCHRMFKYPSQLRDHMMSHGGARPFICTECGMDFMKEHHLRAHLFTHTGLRPFSCPHCHRSFNQKANMVRHMLIHDSERAFKCEICAKTFTQPQTLKAHMVVHSDKKPYSCKFCGKQFGRQHNLQGHLHMHMDSKPYVCSICQSSFTLKGNLNRHKKVKHGLIESTENMEEDAVNFLSSLSDRTRDVGSPEQDLDSNSHDDISTPDSKSNKKARKSTPKKHITQQVFEDANGDREEEANLISYSDEERENEERLSKYFSNTEVKDESGGNGKKQAKIALFKNKEDTYDSDATEIEGEHENEAELDSELEDEARNVIETSSENGIRKPSEGESVNTVLEKRSTRKRKKKELDEDFLDYGESFDDEEVLNEPPRKSAKMKGAILDTLIAEKFKNV